MSCTHFFLDTESICYARTGVPTCSGRIIGRYKTSCHNDKKKFHPTQTVYCILNTEKKGIKCSFKNLMLVKTWYIPLYRNRDRLWQHEPAVLLLSHASGFPVFLLSLTSKVLHSKTIGLLSNLLRIVSFLLQNYLLYLWILWHSFAGSYLHLCSDVSFCQCR